MNFASTRRAALRLLPVAAAITTLIAGSASHAALTPEIERLARKLETQRIAPEPRGVEPQTAIDKTAVSWRLPAQIAALEQILADASTRVAPSVRQALADTRLAWSAYQAGSPDTSLSHLNKTMDQLTAAERALDAAIAAASASMDARLIAVQKELAAAAMRIAHDVHGQAQASGVSARRLAPAQAQIDQGAAAFAAGAYGQAVSRFDTGLGFAANTIVFDIQRFEANLKAAFDPNSTGNAYAISLNGMLHSQGHHGLARTAADAPLTNQSPTKEMQAASVSKPLTAIITLRLLAELGLTPDTPIAPYLPSDWSKGDGVDQLTFRSFLRHRSGFKQNNVAGNDYASLRDVIAKDVGSTSRQYSNTNYAMQRVLIAGLMGIDPVDYGEFDAGALTASAFILKAQEVYQAIGVSVDCGPTDANPTKQYRFPDTGSAGYVDAPNGLTCGGYGWHVSPHELAAVMAHLRYSENLMPAASWQQMRDESLGFNEPAYYSWSNGAFGINQNHGGDWDHSAGGQDNCIMLFPIVVEAAVMVNSSGKYTGSSYAPYGYQCSAISKAFDNAWVPN